MSILYVLVPVALAIVVVAVAAYVWSARSGQFDDLETPSLRPLIDDDPRPTRPAAPQPADGRPGPSSAPPPDRPR